MHRFSAGAATDLQVRERLSIPSLDCIVRRRRLLYFGRLVLESVPILNLLLQSRGSRGTLLPWVQVVMNDILVLKGALKPKLDDLDSPLEEPHRWINFIVKYPKQWKAIVASYHDSCDDIDARQQAASKPYSDSLPVFTCNTCGSVFATNKQLAQHSRIKRKMICVAAQCLPDVSVCPICSNDYHSRTAFVTHSSDLRVRSKGDLLWT